MNWVYAIKTTEFKSNVCKYYIRFELWLSLYSSNKYFHQLKHNTIDSLSHIIMSHGKICNYRRLFINHWNPIQYSSLSNRAFCLVLIISLQVDIFVGIAISRSENKWIEQCQTAYGCSLHRQSVGRDKLYWFLHMH